MGVKVSIEFRSNADMDNQAGVDNADVDNPARTLRVNGQWGKGTWAGGTKPRE